MHDSLKSMVIVFKDEEVTTVVDFNEQNELYKLEKAVKVLEMISDFKKRKQRRIDSINGFSGTFPRLRAEYVNDVDTINRCINRLHKYYLKTIK